MDWSKLGLISTILILPILGFALILVVKFLQKRFPNLDMLLVGFLIGVFGFSVFFLLPFVSIFTKNALVFYLSHLALNFLIGFILTKRKAIHFLNALTEFLRPFVAQPRRSPPSMIQEMEILEKPILHAVLISFGNSAFLCLIYAGQGVFTALVANYGI